MTVLGQDTFVRANQSGWGTASDGQSWTLAPSSGGVTVSISSNEGSLAGSGTESDSVVILGSKTTADCHLLARFKQNSASDNNVGFCWRYTDTSNYYRTVLNVGTIVTQKFVSGTKTGLNTTTITGLTTTDFWWIRMQMVGTTIWVKVWMDGSAEPNVWNATFTDSSLTSGKFGIASWISSGTGLLDSFYVIDYTMAEGLTVSDVPGMQRGPVESLTTSSTFLQTETRVPVDTCVLTDAANWADLSVPVDALTASDSATAYVGVSLPVEGNIVADSRSAGGGYFPGEALLAMSSPLDWDIYQPGDVLPANDSASTMTSSSTGPQTTTYSFTDALSVSDAMLSTETLHPRLPRGQDTFVRANVASGWGTATDGESWTLVPSSGGVTLSVSGNEGVFAGSGTEADSVVLLGSQTATDLELLMRVKQNGDVSNDVGPCWRYVDSQNYYRALIDGSTIITQKFVGGVKNTINSTVVSGLTATDFWWIRLLAVQSTISVKVWKDGTDEPSAWTATFPDNSFSSGQFGIACWANSGSGMIDSFTSFNLIDADTPEISSLWRSPPNPYGVTVFYYDANTLLEPQLIPDMLTLGLSRLRYQLSWSAIETSPGVYNWKAFDDAVNQANTNGFYISFAPMDPPDFYNWVPGPNGSANNIASGGTTGSTSLTLTATPTELHPGMDVVLSGGTGGTYSLTYEHLKVNTVSGTTVTFTTAIQGNSRTTLQWGAYPDTTALANFAQAVASRYNGQSGHGIIDAIEIANEEYDNSGYGTDSGAYTSHDPSYFITALKVVSPAIRAVFPTVRIGMCALMWMQLPHLSDFVTAIRNAGVDALFDYINVHYYPFFSNSNGLIDALGWTYGAQSQSTTPSFYQAWQALQKVSSKPIHFTEYGWYTTLAGGFSSISEVSQDVQARNYLQTYESARQSGGVVQEMNFWTLDYGNLAGSVSDPFSLAQIGPPTTYTTAFTAIKNYIARYPSWATGPTRTLIAVDDFITSPNETGPNGPRTDSASSLGTATDGNTWSHPGGTATLSLSTSEGQFTSSGANTDYIRLGTGTATSHLLTLRCSTANVNDSIGVISLLSGTSNATIGGYSLTVSGTTLTLAKVASGTPTTLTSATVTNTAGTKYWMRLQTLAGATSTQLAATYWQDGTVEPVVAALTYTDSSSPLASGGYGIAGSASSASAVQFDSFSALDQLTNTTMSFLSSLSASDVPAFQMGPVEHLSSISSALDRETYQPGDVLIADDSASSMSSGGLGPQTTTYSFSETLVAASLRASELSASKVAGTSATSALVTADTSLLVETLPVSIALLRQRSAFWSLSNIVVSREASTSETLPVESLQGSDGTMTTDTAMPVEGLSAFDVRTTASGPVEALSVSDVQGFQTGATLSSNNTVSETATETETCFPVEALQVSDVPGRTVGPVEALQVLDVSGRAIGPVNALTGSSACAWTGSELLSESLQISDIAISTNGELWVDLLSALDTATWTVTTGPTTTLYSFLEPLSGESLALSAGSGIVFEFQSILDASWWKATNPAGDLYSRVTLICRDGRVTLVCRDGRSTVKAR